MELVLAFAGIVGGVLLLTHSLAAKGTSYRDILAGNATLNPGPSFASAGAGATAAGSSSTSSAASAASATPAKVTGSVTPSMLQKLGAAKGWAGSEIDAWMQVINAESGGNPNAVNSSSGAYGIAQGIDGPQWYAQHGGNVNTVEGQLTAMANYIQQRYGTPAAAWAHEQANHWY